MAGSDTRNLALLAGVRILFAAIVLALGGRAWWVHHYATWMPPTRSEFAQLQRAGLAVWTIGVAAIVGIAAAAPRFRDPHSAAIAKLVAWSSGEAIACFGAVYYLRTGHPQWYAFGVIAMLGAFALLPLRK
ncbi:MAG: hypothetical protein NVS1B4_06620 [Gemmatimonadaceae bacterium]